MNRRDAVLSLALVLVTLVWGSAFTAIKVVVRVLNPVDLALVRFAVAAVGFAGLLLFLARRGTRVVGFPPRLWLTMAALGLLGVVAYHVSLNVGEERLTRTASQDTAAILSGFLISTNSLFTLLVASLVTSERWGGRRTGGILVALLGTALLVLWGRGDLVDGRSLVGILVVLLAPLSWALYTVLSKRVYGQIHPLVLTSWAMIFGTLFLLPWGTSHLGADLRTLEPSHWAWILVLSVGATFGGYLVWGMALRYWDATRVSSFVYLVPLFGVLVATLFEGEHLTPQIALGGALILAGLAMANTVGRVPTRPPVVPAPAPD